MVKIKEKRPARITIACNACRSRKQKCSGNKPVCGQCLENNRPCNWPEQLRRGPTKGHVEALEHRLQVTEGALLRLLSHVSDSQLLDAFPEDGSIDRNGNPRTYMPLARLGQRGIDDWAKYPLDGAQNIRDWQSVSMGDGTGDSGSISTKADRSPVHHSQDDSTKGRNGNTGKVEGSNLNQDAPSEMVAYHQPHERQEQSLSADEVSSRLHMDQYWLSFEAATRKARMENGSDDLGTVNLQTGGPIDEGSLIQPVQSRSTWEGAPSVNFQQQFLW